MARQKINIGDLVEYYAAEDNEYFKLRARTIYKVVAVQDDNNQFQLDNGDIHWWYMAAPFRLYNLKFEQVIASKDKNKLFKYLKHELRNETR